MQSDGIYRTISQQVIERLRTEILTGKTAPGEPLREEKLAKRFGVSRGPIREALSRLAHEGLLVSEPNVGVKVTNGPAAAVRPLIVQIRMMIETFAVSSFMDRITAEDIQRLEQVLDALQAACERGDVSALRQHDLVFHRTIIELANDEDLLAIWQPIVNRMMVNYSRLSGLMESYAEHRAILEAIRARDLHAASKALEVNIRY